MRKMVYLFRRYLRSLVPEKVFVKNYIYSKNEMDKSMCHRLCTMYPNRFKMNKRGFTMIEIMLVVIIIGILAAMVIPNMSGRGKQARVSAARADIEANLMTALDLYELDTGSYPSTSQGLAALLKKPTASLASANWSGPYLKKKKIPTDPWGRKYVYVSPGTHNPEDFDLSSYGADGIESLDDIVNWYKE